MAHCVVYNAWFVTGFTYQYLNQLKRCQDTIIGNIVFSALLPSVTPWKIDIIGLLVLISVIIFICHIGAQYPTPELCVINVLLQSDVTTLFKLIILAKE